MGRLERVTSTGRVTGEEAGEGDGTGVGRSLGELGGARRGHPVPAGEHPQGQLDDAAHRTAPPERRRLRRAAVALATALTPGCSPKPLRNVETSWSTSP